VLGSLEEHRGIWGASDYVRGQGWALRVGKPERVTWFRAGWISKPRVLGSVQDLWRDQGAAAQCLTQQASTMLCRHCTDTVPHVYHHLYCRCTSGDDAGAVRGHAC
jgi:hypothetical protein